VKNVNRCPLTCEHGVVDTSISSGSGGFLFNAIVQPDQIEVRFDGERLVADAGLLLPATLAVGLGRRELVDELVDLGDTPGRANPGGKAMTLVASALAGAAGSTTATGCAPGRPGRSWATGSSPIHDRHVPALVHLGPRPASWTGSPPRRWGGPGPGPGRGRGRTPSLWTPRSGRSMGWPSRAPPSATPRSAATTRCWGSAPAPATCSCPAARRHANTARGRPAASPRRSTGSVPPAPPGRLPCGPTRASPPPGGQGLPAGWVRSSITAKCNKGSARRSSRSPTTPGRRSAPGWRAGSGGRDQLPPIRQARPGGAADRAPGAPDPGSQLALDVIFDDHRFITDREASPWSWRPTTAATARSNPRSATSSTAWALSICPRVGSPPTPPGRRWSASRPTWPAGPGGSGWASRRSRPRPAHSLPGHPGPADRLGTAAETTSPRPLAVALALAIRTRRPGLHPYPT